MSQTSFRIEQPAFVREKYYPEYLSIDMENFKKKNATYPLTKDDDNAVEFYKKAKDRKLRIVNQVINIYRTKRNNKEWTNYSLNLRLYDDEGNHIGDEFLHVYGCEKHPIIREVIKNNEIALEPAGIRLEHKIPFNAQEVEKIIDMCDDEFKENIKFIYNEIPSDSKSPTNERTTQLIRSEDIFKNATNKQIQKIILKKANEIESLDQLETFAPIVKTIPKPKA